MDEDIKDPREYEVAFLLSQEEALESVKQLFARHNAHVVRDGVQKKIALAYPIKKQSTAVFGYVHVSCTPEQAKALEKDLNTSPTVLRSMMLHKDVKKEKNVSEAKAPARLAHVAKHPEPLSNEGLEKKIEEIMQ